MCLAVPLKIEKIEGTQATVALGGNEMSVSLAVVPKAKLGDWVLIHAGMAITILDEQQAKETFEILTEAYGDPLGQMQER